MKAFETEKNNIPEGATHKYNNERGVGYYKFDGDMWYFWSYANSFWKSVVDNSPSFKAILLDKPEVVKWNGEGLPPVGVECELSNCGNSWVKAMVLFMGTGLCVVDQGYGDQHYHLNSVKFRKPESPEEKEQRERLEAAYDLYCHVQSTQNQAAATFELFTKVQGIMTLHRERYLAIVDKTNYRKGE